MLIVASERVYQFRHPTILDKPGFDTWINLTGLSSFEDPTTRLFLSPAKTRFTFCVMVLSWLSYEHNTTPIDSGTLSFAVAGTFCSTKPMLSEGSRRVIIRFRVATRELLKTPVQLSPVPFYHDLLDAAVSKAQSFFVPIHPISFLQDDILLKESDDVRKY